MAHATVIRGGTVIDGTGAPSRRADVAIDDGRITHVGDVAGPGDVELDAAGALVTPGFVDLHTHLDAQLGWDPLLTPTSQHGVTTALMGNCGMTFAPVRPGHSGLLTEMMEMVEEIPAGAIESALPFTWESFGGFLDFAAAAQPALNLAGMVGHCALRFYVMGERALDDEPTHAELAEMAALADQALREGAAGISTSRIASHVMRDGRRVPGSKAGLDELLALARTVRGRGLFEAVLDPHGFDADFALITEVGIATEGHVLVTAVTVEEFTGDGRPTGVKQPTPELLAEAAGRGADITGSLLPREGGAICGLFARLPWRTPAWMALEALSHADRLAALDDHATRAALIAEGSTERPIGSPRRMFWLGEDVARYMDRNEDTLATLAAEAGEQPVETFVRMSRASKGQAMFLLATFNTNHQRLAHILSSDRFLPGLGDSGAHLNGIVDSSYSTYYLSHWVRDRGLVPAAEAIRLLTSAPADLLGISDRGRLIPGHAADVNVIDFDRLACGIPAPIYDVPGGAPRLTQGARGYRATLVNGTPTVLDDVPTGNRPGGVLRHFATS